MVPCACFNRQLLRNAHGNRLSVVTLLSAQAEPTILVSPAAPQVADFMDFRDLGMMDFFFCIQRFALEGLSCWPNEYTPT